MRFRLPLVAAALVLGTLAGCDSTTVIPEGPTGPTVQFATPNASVAEGNTVTLPVVLTGGDGAPVTVELLYAAGASTACSEAQAFVVGSACFDDGPDFTGFDAPDGDLEILTLTFPGSTQPDTVNVTLTVEDEGLVESAQEAVFALQRAEGATIGANRTFTVIIGTLPIATIREGEDGDIVTVEGVVTRTEGRFVYLQDETAAIVTFSPSGTPLFDAIANEQIEPGDRLQVRGELDEFNGLLEVSFVEDFAVVQEGTEDDIPAPQPVTLTQLASGSDDYEGELVRVTGLTIDPQGDAEFSAGSGSGKSYIVTGPSGATLVLRVPSASDTNIVGTPIPSGTFTFEGVVGQFGGQNQLSPIEATDIIPD